MSPSYFIPQARPLIRTGLLGPPPPGVGLPPPGLSPPVAGLPPSVPGLPPLQNTLIVQHQSGQSVYVQQHIFPPPSTYSQGTAQYVPVNFPPAAIPVSL